MHFHMALTMPKLATHPKIKINSKCDSSSKDEALQVLNHECEDPWKHATNLKGSPC
jgi:hypothetical protein